MFETGQWLWSIEHRQPCKVVEVSRLWDDATYHVWLPATESVVRATSDRLKPLDAAEAGHPARIRYVLYAARIANLLSEDVLLAPGERIGNSIAAPVEGVAPCSLAGSRSLPARR